jgi:hypothetical protein
MSDYDDELPSAPAGGAAAVEVLMAEVPESTYADVPKMGDVIPSGTWHFRLDRYTLQAYEDGPVYSLQWRCQEEPHTGRVMFSNCAWPTAEDVRTANDPDAPKGAKVEAQKRVNDRLVVAKALQEAAGLKPGTKSFKEFLDSHPEIRIQTTITAKKKLKSVADPDKGESVNNAGKVVDSRGQLMFEDTGEQKNKVVKYISLVRPQ